MSEREQKTPKRITDEISDTKPQDHKKTKMKDNNLHAVEIVKEIDKEKNNVEI